MKIMADNRVGAILVRDCNLGPGYLELALKWQAERGGPIGEILIEMRAVTPEQVATALQTQRRARVARGTEHGPGVRERRATGVAQARPAAADRSRRVTLQVPEGTVQIVFDDWNRFVHAYTRNISRGGLGLRTAEQPKVGASITVRITVPNGQHIDLPGRVRYVEAEEGYFSIGVAFERFSHQVERMLNGLVEFARRQLSGDTTDEIRWRG
jgi:hypothetical protein